MNVLRSSLRSCAVGACLASLGLSGLASAEEAKPAAPLPEAEDKLRYGVDLHGGLVYQVGPLDGIDLARGGGLAGATALIWPKQWLSVGVGYERWFLGRERLDEASTYAETARTLDAIWAEGRGYFYRGEQIGLYAVLGLAPIWQGVSKSGTRVLEDPSGQVSLRGFECSAHAFGGMGLRAAAGVDFSLTSLISLNAQLGFDQLVMGSDTLDGCANGMGAASYLSARIGFLIGPGRVPPPEPTPEPMPEPPADTDKDGIADAVDACPMEFGFANADPKKNGCPPPKDTDNDAIIDELDACPNEAGVANEDPKKNGCPPPKDTDGDSVPDDEDACPDIPGVATEDPATNGCPGDKDEDGIRDDKDACPEEKGVANEDPKKNGCPVVQVTDKEIVIAQQVQFETNRALILQESYALLDEVANVIKAHPEITKLEVQGHTDNRGSKPLNKILSQNRADAVRKALIQRGVDAKKLTAVGYGADQPIADNSTEEGMAKNRRVQFKILEKKPVEAKPALEEEKKP